MTRATPWETSRLASAWAIHSAGLLCPGHLRSCFLALTLPHFRWHTCPIHMHVALPRLSGHHSLPVGLCQAGLPSFTASLRWSAHPLPHALHGFHLYYGNSSGLLSPWLVPTSLACPTLWPSTAQVTAEGRVPTACLPSQTTSSGDHGLHWILLGPPQLASRTQQVLEKCLINGKETGELQPHAAPKAPSLLTLICRVHRGTSQAPHSS